MDNYDNSNDSAGTMSGWTLLLTIFAAGLSLFCCLVSLSEMGQAGPNVGDIVSFDPGNGPRYWSQPGILAVTVPARNPGAGAWGGSCLLMPSVMAAEGGSLVIEAKQTSRPPT